MTGVQDPSPRELQDSFVEFAQQLLSQMQLWAESESPEAVTQIRFQFTESNWSYAFETAPSYVSLLYQHFDESLWSIEAANTCAQQHLAAGILEPPEVFQADGTPVENPSYEQMRPMLVSLLLTPIIDLLVVHRSLEPTVEQIRQAYQWFRSGLHDTRPRDMTIPILNVLSDITTPEPIGALLQLAPFTPTDKTRLWNIMPFRFMVDQFADRVSFSGIVDSHMKLVGTIGEGKSTPHTNEQLELEAGILVDQTEDFITAARLLKGGWIGATAIFSEARDSGRPRVALGKLNLSVRETASKYELNREDVGPVVEIFTSIRNLAAEQRSKVQVAIRRFNQSYTRGMPEDRLIDLTIALESCLLEDEEGDIARKFARRGSTMLMDLGDYDIKQTYYLLYAIHRSRSKVVHQGMLLADLIQFDFIKDLGTSTSVEQLPDKCEGLARAVLTAYMDRLRRGQPTKSGIDTSAVANLIAQTGKQQQRHVVQ